MRTDFDSFWAYQWEYGKASNVGTGVKPGAERKMVEYKEELGEADLTFFRKRPTWTIYRPA